MIKKFLLLSLVVSQLTISCSSDETVPETEQTLAEQVANLVKQPYSKLTPTEQKVKLEAEANDMLVQLDKSKTSGAIEALENLTRLLDLNSVDIFSGKNDNKIEDIINTAGVYGVYTWNNTQKIWVKTASTTELKFVFPAKKSQTANNASFSSKAVASDIKVKLIDTYGNWSYNQQTQQYEQSPSVNDYFFLPTSADAVLTIDNTQAATFTQTAKYANGKEVPNEFAYKMTLIDGYAWEMSETKATENTAKASLTFNGKNLIEFNAGSTAQIDALIDNDELVQYRGKANGLFKLMDNFIIVADMDLATEAADEIALEKTLPSSNYDTKTYYSDMSVYNLKYSQGTAVNFNKNMKLILVSKKDGTKIADIVVHSEKSESYAYHQKWVVDATATNGGYWTYDSNGTATVDYYDEVYYLKFSDNTEVEMSAYFSEGFTNFETKFEDFITAFEK
ncbi:hypothetical protein GKZ90_0019080 [Flavobacterium sp. MC2016-06]|uniref:hypothetical protein n=1 Tax=Flavobacterium sp. MC2016-06 TaxID=2676308 RepID=UPI0012BAC27A|nr:hypothetical protein [Flavobacterium sp. MC2016-06]MBU3861237.1 hypothetical protein [Flavobacterium sp. MC2016-06]